MNYEKDMQIDDSALDIEWLEQPMLMMQYSRHAAQMKADLDLIKERLDLLKADLDKKIRLNPEEFDIMKVTESVILSTIISQKEYIDVNGKLIKAKFEFDVALGAVRSIDQKKTALENLVRLHGQQYFAGPSVPRDLSKEWEQKEKQKKANEAVKMKMKRKH